VPFTEKNVRADQDAVRELVENLRSNATPTAKVGDRILIGFDAQAYEEALARTGQ